MEKDRNMAPANQSEFEISDEMLASVGLERDVYERACESQLRRQQALAVVKELAPKAHEVLPDSEVWLVGSYAKGVARGYEEAHVLIVCNYQPAGIEQTDANLTASQVSNPAKTLPEIEFLLEEIAHSISTQPWIEVYIAQYFNLSYFIYPECWGLENNLRGCIRVAKAKTFSFDFNEQGDMEINFANAEEEDLFRKRRREHEKRITELHQSKPDLPEIDLDDPGRILDAIFDSAQEKIAASGLKPLSDKKIDTFIAEVRAERAKKAARSQLSNAE